MESKFSLSIRIDSVTPAHIYVTLFSSMVSIELTHAAATRAKAGSLVFTLEEFPYFLARLFPHMFFFKNVEVEKEYYNHYEVDEEENFPMVQLR